MNEIKKLREGIWSLLNQQMRSMFENMEDAEEEAGADLGVTIEIGMYSGATTWRLGDDDASLIIAVYPDGAVDVTLEEACHKERRICLAGKLGKGDDEMQQILQQISSFTDIMFNGDWHVLMDFMRYKDWREGIDNYQEYVSNCPDVISDVTYI